MEIVATSIYLLHSTFPCALGAKECTQRGRGAHLCCCPCKRIHFCYQTDKGMGRTIDTCWAAEHNTTAQCIIHCHHWLLVMPSRVLVSLTIGNASARTCDLLPSLKQNVCFYMSLDVSNNWKHPGVVHEPAGLVRRP